MDQDATPYLDAMIAYADRNPGRFHVPGHKGGPGADPALREAFGERSCALDLPAGIEGIDVGPDPARDAVRARASGSPPSAWGARRSWFLVNGGSGGNHAICLALAHVGERVVVQRNVHSSTIDGLVLSGLRPRFVAPELDPELGIAHCLVPEALDAGARRRARRGRGDDRLPDLLRRGRRRRARSPRSPMRAACPLVVDEAWGSHMHFSSALPTAALECGADVVLSSVHKIVGSITQSAILHLGEGDRIDERIVDRAVTLIETTSPNAMLTASLDAARRQAATRGEELLAETVDSLAVLRERIRSIRGLDVLDERIVGRAGVHAYDPMRLVVDVRGTGATGHRIARLMREQDDINLELFAENVVVAVFGIGEQAAETGERLVEGLEHACERLGEEEEEPLPPFAEPPPWGPTELSPREAFLAGQEVVAFDAGRGPDRRRVAGRLPARRPERAPGRAADRGRRSTYIADSVAHGGLVRGASDRTLERSEWCR